MTCDDMLTLGGGGDDFKHISRVISNLNIEKAAELKKYSSATRATLFCCNDKGEEGGLNTPQK